MFKNCMISLLLDPMTMRKKFCTERHFGVILPVKLIDSKRFTTFDSFYFD